MEQTFFQRSLVQKFNLSNFSVLTVPLKESNAFFFQLSKPKFSSTNCSFDLK